MMELNKLLEVWQQKYNCKVYDPVALEILDETVAALGPFPDELVELYKQTNGMSLDWFKILPIEDKRNIKRTWDGLKRANDPKRTEYLDGNEELLRRFLVFAEIGGRTCAVIDRCDKSIWYEEAEKLNRTTFSIPEFIEACLKEAKESSEIQPWL